MRTRLRNDNTGEEHYFLHGPGTGLLAEYKRVNDTLVPVREYLSIGDRVVASVDQIPGNPPSSCNLTFTDDPIQPDVTPVKAIHTTELRDKINCVRAWFGLSPYAWTDPTITPDVTVVNHLHIEEMRTALDQAYTGAGATHAAYTDAALTNVGIKAQHFNELRSFVRNLTPPQPATTAAMRYYHTDPLGSVRAITDANGAQVERRDYYAFGDSQPLEGNPLRFTGKELDVPNVGLTYFGARYYTHVDARFTTVDPYTDLGGAIVDPQQWNRYAYVLNDPETLVDPLGLKTDPCQGPSIPGVFWACGVGRWPLDFGFFGFSPTPRTFAPEDEPARSKQRARPCSEVKSVFISTNSSAAAGVASQLNVPSANILGLAAEETGWGTSPIALNAHNFFGIHAGAPGSIGPYTTSGGAKVSMFPANTGFLASAQSFAANFGYLVKGISNPTSFAQALVPKFNPANAAKGGNPNFVRLVSGTIRAVSTCGG